MNLTVRLADGTSDAFHDETLSVSGLTVTFTQHQYKVDENDTLRIIKVTFSAIDSPDRDRDRKKIGKAEVGLYRPSQWTNVRES